MARTINAGQMTITDDGRIVTSAGDEIPLDEPVFLLRARNPLAAKLLTEYAARAGTRGLSVLMQEILHLGAAEFLRFRRQHPDRMQLPEQPLPHTGPLSVITEGQAARAVSDALQETDPSRAQAR